MLRELHPVACLLLVLLNLEKVLLYRVLVVPLVLRDGKASAVRLV